MAFFDFIVLIAFLVFIVSRFLSHKLPKAPKRKKGPPSPRQNMRRFQQGDEDAEPTDAKIISFEEKVNPKKERTPNLDTLEGLEGAAKIQAVDPSFNEKEFLEGAKIAYGLYWQAVMDGDEETLDNLTCPRLFDEIMAKVEDLDTQNKHLLTRVDSVEAELLTTNVTGKTALVEVKYTVTQAQTEVKKETTKTSAKAKEAQTVWTWARNLNDEDPNWELEDIKGLN